MTGEENNGQLHLALRQFLLQLQPAQARELDIEHQAARGRWPLVGQKLLGGGKCLNVEPRRAEKTLQTLAR
jgi:hypothetical protein